MIQKSLSRPAKTGLIFLDADPRQAASFILEVDAEHVFGALFKSLTVQLYSYAKTISMRDVTRRTLEKFYSNLTSGATGIQFFRATTVGSGGRVLRRDAVEYVVTFLKTLEEALPKEHYLLPSFKAVLENLNDNFLELSCENKPSTPLFNQKAARDLIPVKYLVDSSFRPACNEESNDSATDTMKVSFVNSMRLFYVHESINTVHLKWFAQRKNPNLERPKFWSNCQKISPNKTYA